ncbi:porin family protein [Gilvimarinus algae]|uniref:Porin family protein n=1 Tax=Gilvimarinus algae TaxID=3058037 RepID=A0ABT8TKQ9_9GAMM|nr:porin family protein [Gilvimarinus sp. SDUM040014]MDO3382947.1 porin family protein [Gilvimarinus sp. SDUM040014]
MVKKISSVVALSALSSMAFAQQAESGWRFQPEFSIGGGYGLTKLKDEDFSEDEAAKKAFAVLKFNEYIGIEGAYIDFDEASNGAFSFDPTGASLGLIIEAPITQVFSVYAKGGQLWWDADARVSTDIGSLDEDFDGDETFWGAGTKFQLAEHLDLRIEYERFNFDISRDEVNVLQTQDIDMDVDFASVNLQYTF